MDLVSVETGGAFGESAAGDARDVAGHHDGATDGIGGEIGSFGEGFDHDTFERALADLAHEQSGKELLLGSGGAGQERVEKVAAAALGAGAFDGGEIGERVVQLVNAECGGFYGIGGCAAQRGPADADAALPGVAGEPGDDDFDFFGVELAQQRGEEIGLLQASRGLGNAAGDVDYSGKEH